MTKKTIVFIRAMVLSLAAVILNCIIFKDAHLIGVSIYAFSSLLILTGLEGKKNLFAKALITIAIIAFVFCITMRDNLGSIVGMFQGQKINFDAKLLTRLGLFFEFVVLICLLGSIATDDDSTTLSMICIGTLVLSFYFKKNIWIIQAVLFLYPILSSMSSSICGCLSKIKIKKAGIAFICSLLLVAGLFSPVMYYCVKKGSMLESGISLVAMAYDKIRGNKNRKIDYKSASNKKEEVLFHLESDVPFDRLRGASYCDYDAITHQFKKNSNKVSKELLSNLVLGDGEYDYSVIITPTSETDMVYTPYGSLGFDKKIVFHGDSYITFSDGKCSQYKIMFDTATSINTESYQEYSAAYLQVPKTFKNALSDFLSQYDIDPESEDKSGIIEDIQNIFLNDFNYSLSLPKAKTSEDPILYFLETKTGYCLHYASAATMLFRMCGIPARFTEGYLVNFVDGNAVVTTRNAHAWVEVWFEGSGWVPVEVTNINDANNAAAETTEYVEDPAAENTAEPVEDHLEENSGEEGVEIEEEKQSEDIETSEETADDNRETTPVKKPGRISFVKLIIIAGATILAALILKFLWLIRSKGSLLFALIYLCYKYLKKHHADDKEVRNIICRISLYDEPSGIGTKEDLRIMINKIRLFRKNRSKMLFSRVDITEKR